MNDVKLPWAARVEAALAALDRQVATVQDAEHRYRDATEDSPCTDPACARLHLRAIPENTPTWLGEEADRAAVHYRSDAVRSLVTVLAERGEPSEMIGQVLWHAKREFRTAHARAVGAQHRMETEQRRDPDSQQTRDAAVDFDAAMVERCRAARRVANVRQHLMVCHQEAFFGQSAHPAAPPGGWSLSRLFSQDEVGAALQTINSNPGVPAPPEPPPAVLRTLRAILDDATAPRTPGDALRVWATIEYAYRRLGFDPAADPRPEDPGISVLDLEQADAALVGYRPHPDPAAPAATGGQVLIDSGFAGAYEFRPLAWTPPATVRQGS